MKLAPALAAGFAGSLALTLTHQLLHPYIKDAPRMDLMGEEALLKLADKANVTVAADKVYAITMAGDLAGNALYYSLAGACGKEHAVVAGAALGLAAGIGGVYLPKPLGLTNAYSDRTLATKLMTVGIYLLGGIVAGCVARKM